ncbi:MAG TPA: hypothetical protein VFO10_13155 [Oligoflexus sp.]|uniref:hypothetical protein n=1 Tax=Oligoflexus sp. TaxID=1971216 RepID=UPI002D7EFD05|nr:hypothetical protein [Oligoflexus sp.]HET9238201.1 hypothetical protein [Oligoflexus sp.]
MNENQEQNTDFLDQDDCDALAKAMESKYAMALKGRSFRVEAEVKGRGVFVKVILSNQDKSYYYPVEARVLYEKEEMQRGEAALFLLDYIDAYFDEYLTQESEEIYLPIDWADFQYEAIDFQMRGQILNLKLEELAEEFLKKGSPAVH